MVELLEPFETSVPKQLADGTGYVKAGRRHVQAGPVHSRNGTEVIAVLLSENHALILSKFAVADYYSEYVSEMKSKFEVPDRFLRIHRKDRNELDSLVYDGIIKGYQFEAKISNITDDGVGIVNGPLGNEILIGPITSGINKKVQLEYLENSHAYCHDTSIQAEDYSVRLNISAERYDELPVKRGDTYAGSVIGVIGNQVRVELEKSGIHTHVESNGWLEKGESVRVRITGFASQSAKGELMSIANSKSNHIDKKNGKTQTTTSASELKSKELKKLREKAEKDTKQSNDNNSSTVTASTNQYNRSNAVRQYAKKRANGRCEGCNSPAPFQNKNNEPYLHVHHLEELSEGGDDSPYNVICLCPNCHYRIHHGNGGSEYNRRLKKKVNRIEANTGGPPEESKSERDNKK